MSVVELDDYRWLTSDAAEPWLARAAAHEAKLASLVRLLRRELSAPRAHLVIEQIELRRRAREKFTRPADMLFTRRALEQASGERPAEYKAARFTANDKVLDLCCGIGGDLLALAARGSAVGVDRDPVLALLAAHNCRVLGLDEVPVLSSDVTEACIDKCSAWHIDPDRRAGGRRVTRVESYEPGMEVIERLLHSSGSAAVKLAPAAVAPERWTSEAELEWIGDQGECKQQVAWFGRLARHAGQRAATILTAGASPRSVVGQECGELPTSSDIGRFVFEPQAAVLAARLAHVLAAEHKLATVADRGGYLTGDEPVIDAALSAFEVDDVLPLDMKKLKSWLRERSIGRLEIKLRGVKDDPQNIRRRLQLSGERAATLLVTRFSGQVRAILARRVGSLPLE